MEKNNKRPEPLKLTLHFGSSVPRVVEIPLFWIPASGFFVGALAICLTASLLFSFRMIWTARNSDSSKIQFLEEELSGLKERNEQLQNENTTLSQNKNTKPADTTTSQSPGQDQPNPHVPENLKAVPVSPSKPILSDTSQLFNAINSGQKNLTKDAAAQSISIDTPRLAWRGRSLRAHFNLHYIKDDRGNQQGRIVLLARGPETLLAYPSSVFSKPGTAALIQYQNGEYFSVSRFREVNAEFSTQKEPTSLTDIEILIFNSDGDLLIHQTIGVPSLVESRTRTRTRNAPTKTDSDAEDSTELSPDDSSSKEEN